MEFGKGKYAMLIMKNEKRHMTGGMELPKPEKSEHYEKRNL